MDAIADLLGPAGRLAQAIPGFSYRHEQVEMAEAVMRVLGDGGTLVAEAGTGTGKTFAYLVPALLSGLKVIISTGTRNLQDQLFLRDLPRVRDALASPARTALLKGRANYLCPYRLDVALSDPRGQRRDVIGLLHRVREWSRRTDRGDIAELIDIPEDAPVWPLVTSTAENCLGADCPAWNKCHLVEARRRAQEADIVVVNHHLLCADFALKDDGFGELLPTADAFIVDEAHQLPDVASNFFGASVSTRQILELANDTKAEYHREAGDLPKLEEQTDKVAKAARDLRLAVGADARRGTWKEFENEHGVQQAMSELQDQLETLHGMLEAVKGRGQGLDSCLERCTLLRAVVDELWHPDDTDEVVRWFETHLQSLRLNSTPLDIAEVFQEQMARHRGSWVFTSATLAVGDDFSHFESQLGLTGAHTARWDSPFDYQRQALWFVPRGLPEPRDSQYTAAMMDLVLPVLRASHGRAFLLFTSHRALQAASVWLEGKTEYPLLVQGSAPKAELLEQFVRSGNAVLLGTSSFWEGVDVRGSALSLVVIDKLPFAAPGDPVLQARLDALRNRGGNPFMQYQVPQAAIALKQGAGRLIRDEEDSGVLVVCDPRLLRRDKSYGQIFLNAMPAFARTREVSDVIGFFQTHDSVTEVET